MDITQLDRNDPKQMEMLDCLMERVFGFTFERWRASGRWDDRYVCHTISDGERVIASVSAASLELLVGGRPLKAIQLGAVATLPEYRGRGLARQVMEHVLRTYASTPMLLFAHRGVLGFYSKFGFRQAPEAQPSLALTKPTGGSACQRLTPDSPVLARLLSGRRRVSGIIDARDADYINWFHILMEFPDDIYHIPEHDAIIVARRHERKLVIFDVLGGDGTAFEELLQPLPFASIDSVEFAFTPDWLCPHYDLAPFDADSADSYLYVRGLDFPTGAKFPYLAMT